MQIFKSALHYIEHYKLVLNAFVKRNVLSFLKVPRLLGDLIGNGNEFHMVGATLEKREEHS